MFIRAKIAISEKEAKTRHKSTSNTADKHSHTPVKVSLETRVCTSPAPGSVWWVHPGLKRLCKLFLTKEKPVLMKKHEYEAAYQEGYDAPYPKGWH